MTQPIDIIRLIDPAAERDVERRTISGVIATRCIASDGGIIHPPGIRLDAYRANSIVLPGHQTKLADGRSPVIGRSLALRTDDRGLHAVTQFADTELGREYAYLYGLNPEGEIYMRAWSLRAAIPGVQYWTRDQARAYLGEDYDPAAAGRAVRIWYAPQSDAKEYSAVAIGSDRHALSRAWQQNGIETAGALIAKIDLDQADGIARSLSGIQTLQSQLDQIHREIQALRSDGSAAAARGDSAEILDAIQSLTRDISVRARPASPPSP